MPNYTFSNAEKLVSAINKIPHTQKLDFNDPIDPTEARKLLFNASQLITFGVINWDDGDYSYVRMYCGYIDTIDPEETVVRIKWLSSSGLCSVSSMRYYGYDKGIDGTYQARFIDAVGELMQPEDENLSLLAFVLTTDKRSVDHIELVPVEEELTDEEVNDMFDEIVLKKA